MSNYMDMRLKMEYSDYDRHFWNAMRGKLESYDHMNMGKDTATGNYVMAPVSDDKFTKARAKESLFRQIATNICAYGSGYRIWAKDTNDLALFVPEGSEIPLESTIHDFTVKSVDSHKLAVFVKTDEDFIRDASFDFESYLVTRLAKNFGRAEENGFINGTGVIMPTGILAENGGADVGVTTAVLTYDDVVKLFFSVKSRYRRHAVWIMNDETAYALRSIKDANGNYIWNHANDTILGHKVYISEFMPNAEPGNKPIAFGDFRYYWVVGRQPVCIRPLVEKYIAIDCIGYRAYEFMDGKLVRPEAIILLRLMQADFERKS